MVGRGTRSIIERVETGNSRPWAARASALTDNDAYRSIIRRLEVQGIQQL